MLASSSAMSADALDCKIGPATKQYGGTTWLVYACNDGRSAVVVTAPGSPATPFYFVFSWQGGIYRLIGEGTGNKKLTDAAYADLNKLGKHEIAGLLTEARSAKP